MGRYEQNARLPLDEDSDECDKCRGTGEVIQQQERQPDSVQDDSAEDLRERRAELKRDYIQCKSYTETEITRLEAERADFKQRQDIKITKVRVESEVVRKVLDSKRDILREQCRSLKEQIRKLDAQVGQVNSQIRPLNRKIGDNRDTACRTIRNLEAECAENTRETDAKISEAKTTLQDKRLQYYMSLPFDPCNFMMTLEEASQLKAGDYLDHQHSDIYPFEYAKVLRKRDTKLLIHYEGYDHDDHWDGWFDYRVNLGRFAWPKSISAIPVTAEGAKDFFRSASRRRTGVAVKINDQWVKGTSDQAFKRCCASNQVQIKYYRNYVLDDDREVMYKVYHLNDTKHIRFDPDAPCTSCAGKCTFTRKDAAKALLDVTPIPEAIAQLISSFVKRVECRTCGKTGTCAAVATSPEIEPEIDDSSSSSSSRSTCSSSDGFSSRSRRSSSSSASSSV